MGVEHGIVRKSGAWYTYEGDQLGQGKENARAFLRDNPDLADEIEKKIKEKLGVGPRVDTPPAAPARLLSVSPTPAGGGDPARPGRRRPPYEVTTRRCQVRPLTSRRRRPRVRRPRHRPPHADGRAPDRGRS